MSFHVVVNIPMKLRHKFKKNTIPTWYCDYK